MLLAYLVYALIRAEEF
ncbi:MAG: K(+)-transporting ATPase subunit F [Polaromonas sp.]